MKPALILVGGVPGSGKTTLSLRLAQKYRLPLIAKDGLKESLFDSLGWSDRAWSKKVGLASYRVMDYVADAMAVAKASFILESNFKAPDAPKLRRFCEEHGYQPLQLYCDCDKALAFARFEERARQGRHPGHADADNLGELRELILRWHETNGPLWLGGDTVNVDTTDFAAIDYGSVYAAIERHVLPVPA